MIVHKQLLGLLLLHPLGQLAQEPVIVHSQQQPGEIGCCAHRNRRRMMILEVRQQLEHYDALSFEVALDPRKLDLEIRTLDCFLIH